MFTVKGLYCLQRAGYILKHVPLNRLNVDEKKAQIDHIEQNKNSTKFITGGHWLPQDQRHFLETDEQC